MEQINWSAIIVGFAVGWVITKLIQGYLEAKNLMLEAELDSLTKTIKESMIHVDIEKHGSVFYLFEKSTGNFIAQGTSFEEISKHCKERFKNKSVVASEEQMEKYGLN
jgi:uncharacterized membrane-anchored protein YhcB (DUF1043 family)